MSCSVLHWSALCCTVLHCVALCCMWGCKDSQAQSIMNCSVLHCVALCYSVLCCVALCCSVGRQGFAGTIDNELQRVAMCFCVACGVARICRHDQWWIAACCTMLHVGCYGFAGAINNKLQHVALCCAVLHVGYGVVTVSRIDKTTGLSCRIASLLSVSFAKGTYNFIDPTNCSHPIARIHRHDKYWVAACCTVLRGAMWRSVVQRVAVCGRVLQDVACGMARIRTRDRTYGVALVSRINKIIGFFRKIAL